MTAPHPQTAVEQHFTVPEIAERLHLDAGTVRQEIYDGHLAAIRFGRQFRVAASDLQAWLDRRRFRPEAAPSVESPRGSTTNETSFGQMAREVGRCPRLTPVQNVRQEGGR